MSSWQRARYRVFQEGRSTVFCSFGTVWVLTCVGVFRSLLGRAGYTCPRYIVV